MFVMKDNLVGTPDTPNLVNVEVWGPKFGSVALGQCQVPDVMCQHFKNIHSSRSAIHYLPLSSSPCNKVLFTSILPSYQKRVRETFGHKSLMIEELRNREIHLQADPLQGL